MVYHRDPAPDVARSQEFRVFADGEEVFVYQDARQQYETRDFDGAVYRTVHDRPAFALLSADGPLTLEIEIARPYRQLVVRPLSAKVTPLYEHGRVKLTLDRPRKLSLELDGNLHDPLFLLVNPKETEIPDRGDPRVRYYEGGRVYEEDVIELGEGETLYLEPGAVLYATVRAKDAKNVRVMGRGLVCGLRHHIPSRRRQMLLLEDCPDARIEGLTFYYGPGWHIVPVACDGARIRDLNVITHVPSGDGIDLVSCRDVVVENCFVKVNDDCVVVKATREQPDVRGILVKNCVLWSATHGNGLEIGYELRCDTVSHLVFRDLDIIHAELEGYQSGATISIHNGDGAVVEDVLFEDIRVEDAQEKLFDVKVVQAVWSRQPKRGKIRNVTFRDIAVVDGVLPASIVRGFETKESVFRVDFEGEEKRLYVTRDLRGAGCVEHLRFENVTYQGQRLTSAADLKMIVEIATDVRFD